MNRKFNVWEWMLLGGVLCMLLTGAQLSREQGALADRLIRLHVIGHSDRQEDQELKLAVRDRVLEQARAIWPEDATLEEARTLLEEHLDLLEAAGQAVVAEQGMDYPVSARLEECWFPTREYESFSLPAGNYTALRVVIGDGVGQNWWCVAFPPLCMGVLEDSAGDRAALAGYFSPEQVSLVTQESPSYVLKLKGMEWMGHLWKWLS